MSTFGGILSTARSAIAAHQTAMQVTSHNVANAETPGYTRQRAELMGSWPAVMPYGNLGTGVLVHDIRQIRDPLLDATLRRESSQASGFGLQRDLLGQVEQVFGEPSEQAFAATLDAFWSAWADLANAPLDATARRLVQQRGAQVATALNGMAARFDAIAGDTHQRLRNAVGELNESARQVAELNRQIVAAEAGGHAAGDLRDTRNQLLDRMAGLAQVQVIERRDGSVAVSVASQTLVDGVTHKAIDVGGTPDAVQLTFSGDADVLPSLGGELGAMTQLLNGDLPQLRARLDELAAGIVGAVNGVHRTGWSPTGDPDAVAPPGWTGSNVDFFAAGGTTAATIALDAGVAADPNRIAVGNVHGATGSNAVALALSQLRDTAVPVGTPPASGTLAAFYRGVVSDVGVRTGAATSAATVHETLAAQAEVRRQSVSGVSTDEELVQLMRHQQAYVAATRLVGAVEEMADALLGMV